MRSPKPFNRAGVWYLVRRVPTAYRHLDKRSLVYASTGIRVVDDPRGGRAIRVVAELNEALEQSWRDLEAGRKPNAARSFEQARRSASQFGLAYKVASEIAGSSQLTEILHRVAALERADKDTDGKAIEAALGGIAPPPLLLSGLTKAFEAEQAASLKALSPDQLRRWRNPKNRAAQDLIEVIGDKQVTALTRADALAFRDHWRERVIKGKAEIGTANKNFGHIGKMLRTIENAQQLGIPLEVFSKLRLEGEKEGQRTAYDPDFVQDVILKEGAFSELNPEARRVIYVMAETGLRVSEVVNMLPSHIHIDHAVPHIEVKAEGRKLKTEHSARKMPLVGCALEAMKLQPYGFPRYRDKSASLSALVSKALNARKMRPTPQHSLYSLRHTFEDRLTALDPPDKIIAVLMGHKHARPKYGQGPTLEHLKSWLDKIAFKPPTRL